MGFKFSFHLVYRTNTIPTRLAVTILFPWDSRNAGQIVFGRNRFMQWSVKKRQNGLTTWSHILFSHLTLHCINLFLLNLICPPFLKRKKGRKFKANFREIMLPGVTTSSAEDVLVWLLFFRLEHIWVEVDLLEDGETEALVAVGGVGQARVIATNASLDQALK